MAPVRKYGLKEKKTKIVLKGNVMLPVGHGLVIRDTQRPNPTSLLSVLVYSGLLCSNCENEKWNPLRENRWQDFPRQLNITETISVVILKPPFSGIQITGNANVEFLFTFNRLAKLSRNFSRAGERDENFKTCAMITLHYIFVDVDLSAKFYARD